MGHASPWSSVRWSWWRAAPPPGPRSRRPRRPTRTKLVSAAHQAGVAPDLTVEVAESLYGTSAPQICDVLEDGVSSAESLILNGNPSGRREKLITTDAITYERLVVKTYCPDELSTFDDLAADIDGTETTS